MKRESTEAKQTKSDFLELCAEYDSAHGADAYNIGHKMLTLMNRYHNLTGVWLRKPRRS